MPQLVRADGTPESPSMAPHARFQDELKEEADPEPGPVMSERRRHDARSNRPAAPTGGCPGLTGIHGEAAAALALMIVMRLILEGPGLAAPAAWETPGGRWAGGLVGRGHKV